MTGGLAPTMCQLVAVQEERIAEVEKQAAHYASKMSRCRSKRVLKAWRKANTDYAIIKLTIVDKREALEQMTSADGDDDQESLKRTRKVQLVGEDVSVPYGGLKGDGGRHHTHFDRSEPAYQPGKYSHPNLQPFEDTSFAKFSWSQYWLHRQSIAEEEDDEQALESEFSADAEFDMAVYERMEHEGKIVYEDAAEKVACWEPGSEDEEENMTRCADSGASKYLPSSV